MTNLRFTRTEQLLGADGMKNLQTATVMIVGLGAVGGYALEGLARSGVGHLILVDFDRFELSNVNRQILALTSTIGNFKTKVAANRVAEINPDCEIVTENIRISAENIGDLLNRKIDYVVDAIDSIKEKCDLIAALWQKGIPFISSMGAALRTDCSRVRMARLSQTNHCTMARRVRQILKKRGVKIEDIDCVFSDENCILSANAIQLNTGGKNILGSLPTVTAVFGLHLANEVILRIAKGK